MVGAFSWRRGSGLGGVIESPMAGGHQPPLFMSGDQPSREAAAPDAGPERRDGMKPYVSKPLLPPPEA